MTTYTNVLWYINKNKRWVWQEMSYDDILVMDTATAVAALLNTDVEVWTTKLAWHLSQEGYVLDKEWNVKEWSDGKVKYDSENETFVVESTPTPVETGTMTIVWDETENPENFFLRYEDDAAELTQWSTAFDEFFGYSAVRLNSNWEETAEVTQTTPWQLDVTQLWDLTTGDNVMIKFPVRWIKMSKEGSVVTLSITKEKNKQWYQYYAFNRNWTIQDAMYLWAYKATGSASKLTSLSNASPVTNITIDDARTWAMANGTNYQQETIWQRWYINALYMMKYWNPNSQSVVWQWYVDWGAKQKTWATNSQTNATYGTTSTTGRVKLFWLEDWRGNVNEWTDWLRSTSSRLLLADISNNATSIATRPSSAGWNWISTWVSYGSNTSWNILSVVWTNEWMFMQTWMSWSDYSKYYTDDGVVGDSRVAFAGGGWYYGSVAGAFRLGVSGSASASNSGIGARLMCL